jgi:ubiquinone biosynthesis protein Coq4/tellurite resistance protein
MKNLYIEADRLDVCLRAVKTLALADGRFDAREEALLDAAARAFTPPDREAPDSASLEPITPEETAAQLTDPITRTRLIQSMLIAALIDGEVSKVEYAQVKAFAQALDVDEPRLRNLKQILGEHSLLLKLDLNRKSALVDTSMGYAYRTEGLRGLWKSIAPIMSKSWGLDHDLAARYHKLGLLPESTFGRQYWIHIRQRGFSFPGEPSGFPVALMKHDCCHVLGGYDTDPAGECQVVSFIAGFMQADPFWYLFMVAVHMHLGVETFHKNPLGHLAIDPPRVLYALQRGRAVNRNLYEPGLDWMPYFEMDLDAVRAEFNIGPAYV